MAIWQPSSGTNSGEAGEPTDGMTAHAALSRQDSSCCVLDKTPLVHTLSAPALGQHHLFSGTELLAAYYYLLFHGTTPESWQLPRDECMNVDKEDG